MTALRLIHCRYLLKVFEIIQVFETSARLLVVLEMFKTDQIDRHTVDQQVFNLPGIQ